MDIMDSGIVKNKIYFRSIIFFILTYLSAVVATLGIIIIISFFVWPIAYIICRKEINQLKSLSTSFNRNYPLRYFGSSRGKFMHVYYHRTDLEPKIFRRVYENIISKTPISQISAVNISDRDPSLNQDDNRVFFVASSPSTIRGTKISLAFQFSKFGNMQTVQWWVLAGGYIDRDKHFLFIALAPMTIWLWIIPYLMKQYDLTSIIRTVYNATYNALDIQAQIRCLHEVVFSALIDELGDQGIDTGALRTQRDQMMNINITGGNTTIGNIIQGITNKFTLSTGV